MKRRLKRQDLDRIFLRCFLIQGSWNYKSMVGLGFCYCAIPIMRALCQTPQERQEFLRRHLDFFNAHPYFASWCLGAVAKLEEESICKNWTDQRPIVLFKERLTGPLGAIGDKMFWNGIKPAAAALAVCTAMVAGWIAIPVFLLVYNIPHIYTRLKGIREGYRSGFDIISALSMRKFQKVFDGVAIIGAFITGLTLIIAASWTCKADRMLLPIFLFSAIMAVILLKFKKSIQFIILFVTLIALSYGYIFL
ncbi:PTS mannose/fructose/sorbose transporter family subunit IID [candidate division KSB1 bacterium]|nr:PTS mannose/fructose/sorbose transporter family subunit IID [candidate division KSB1 bacterium]